MSFFGRRRKINDAPKEGEGVLCLTFGDTQSIEISGLRIHFDRITNHGDGASGNQECRVIIMGPKQVPVIRRKR